MAFVWYLGTASPFAFPPSQLRIDHLAPSGSAGTPLLAIQNAAPQFSWALNHQRRGAYQSAYRLVLNQTKTLSSASSAVWDTGVVRSDASVGVQYGGKSPLVSDADYAWSVAWQDELGVWSDWSAVAHFSTALLAAANADWAGTAWVGGLTPTDDRNQLRRSFTVLPAGDATAVEVMRARCYVAAPGGHQTFLNGVRLQSSTMEGAEDAALASTVQFSSRLPYEVFDCTEALRAGGAENVLATTLGRCWFAMDSYGGLGYATIGARSLRVLITAELGAAASGGSGPTQHWTSARNGAGWKHARGPIVKDHLFLGIQLDGRRESPGWRLHGFDDSSWASVPVLHGILGLRAFSPPPDGTPDVPFLVLNATTPPLVALQIPPIRRLAPIGPVSIVMTAPGVAVVDMGINMAGTCEIVVEDSSAASPGDVMLVRHAEGLTVDGRLDQNWLVGVAEISSYTFRGDGSREVYSEVFTYFGFRFIEVTGFPGGVAPPADAITCWFTHTDLEQSGAIDFIPKTSTNSTSLLLDSAAAVLSALHAAVQQSALSNFHSHPTDCPSREKRGWTGDGGHAAEALMLNFNMGAPYAKWLDDVDNAACAAHHVPNIAPGNFHHQAHGDCFGINDPGWESGFVDVLHWTHRYNGDEAALALHWSAMQGSFAYLGSFVSNATGDILTVTGEPGTNLGDWCAPSGNVSVPTSGKHLSNIISGYFWIRQLETMAATARLMGNNTAEVDFIARAGIARTIFGKLYFDSERGVFRDPDWVPEWGAQVMQTEQALAITLCLDLQDGYGYDAARMPVPIVAPADVKRAAAALAANVSAGLNAGMVGIKHVFSALAATGHGDVALTALTSTSYPSYGYMLANGEGTLWEHWEGAERNLVDSRNHIMLGSPGQFLYQRVAGIDVGRGGVAFNRVAIAPLAAASAILRGVDATVGTPRGAVVVSWRVLRDEPELCGEAAEMNGQGAPVHFVCPPNSTISTIAFASYGTPTGTCADADALTIDPTCNAPSSLAVANASCVGKQSCTLFANDTQFGGVDPCHGVRKRLVIAGSCANACAPHYILNATVPGGSNATITLPDEGSETAVVITESGIPIFSNGSFVPHVASGVEGVRAVVGGFEVMTGGGHYSLAVLRCTSYLRGA